jgi:uncharacterized protein YndB with AHSA1/START domain
MRKQFSEVPKNEPVIVLTHVYDAPRALVWEAFTKPEHLQHWWGPDGFTIEHKSADMREGGYWSFIMVGPDGTRWENYHQYTEYRPMDRIRHRHGSKADDPDAFDSLITFKDAGEKTEVTMRMSFPTIEARKAVLAFNADTLGLQTLGKLDAYLETMGG